MKPAGLVAHNRIYADIHILDLDAGEIFHDVPHPIHNRAAHGGNIYAVPNDDVQLDGDRFVISGSYTHAAGQGFLFQQPYDAVAD